MLFWVYKDLQWSQRRFCHTILWSAGRNLRLLLWTCKMISGLWFGTVEFYHCWLFQAYIKIAHYKSERTVKWFEHLLQTLKFHPCIIYVQIVTCLACEIDTSDTYCLYFVENLVVCLGYKAVHTSSCLLKVLLVCICEIDSTQNSYDALYS